MIRVGFVSFVNTKERSLSRRLLLLLPLLPLSAATPASALCTPATATPPLAATTAQLTEAASSATARSVIDGFLCTCVSSAAHDKIRTLDWFFRNQINNLDESALHQS